MPYAVAAEAAARLEKGRGWARRWTTVWKASRAKVVCPVQDLAGFRALASAPVRGFTWRASQRHRPGLKFVLTTGRMHGFESLEERRSPLALDFTNGMSEVLLMGIAGKLLFADNTQQRITGLFDAAFHTRESRTSWARFFAHHARTCPTRLRDITRPSSSGRASSPGSTSSLPGPSNRPSPSRSAGHGRRGVRPPGINSPDA
ncbi:hypothetical protein [Streptomyces sp. NBC_00316]|uniref:hypothetical protein n=1 Tax=Streptomyces sp. NBC_00316 TaxID=2975710 RepID=UPI002E2C0DCC|nr:hypothetical protein [Streptomyces sp. NBC_00316]